MKTWLCPMTMDDTDPREPESWGSYHPEPPAGRQQDEHVEAWLEHGWLVAEEARIKLRESWWR